MPGRIKITEEDLGVAPSSAPAPLPAPVPAPPAYPQAPATQPWPAAPTPAPQPWQAGPPGPPALPPGAEKPKRDRPRWFWWAIGGGVAALIAVVVTTVLLLTSGPSAEEEYAAHVRSSLAPMVEADEQVASALRALSDESTASAKAAVSSARSATGDARRTLGSRPAPTPSDPNLSAARSALSAQTQYLDAVARVLEQPARGGRSGVVSAEQQLTRALDDINAPGADLSGAIGGAEQLTAWAEERARVERNRARARADRRRQESEEREAAAAASAAATAEANSSRDCGGVTAGPGTTCQFALAVRSAYYSVPGATATVDVYSVGAGRVISMYCTPVGGAVRCTGGVNASVTF